MKEKWEELQAREKALVIAMALFLIVFIFYWAVWQPLNSNIENQQKKITKQQELLVWVDKNIARYKAQNTNKPNSNRSLTTVVNSTAQQLEIKIARMNPQGEELQISIDEITFNTLLTMLENLAKKEGIFVSIIDISPTPASGVVKVRRLTLGRG